MRLYMRFWENEEPTEKDVYHTHSPSIALGIVRDAENTEKKYDRIKQAHPGPGAWDGDKQDSFSSETISHDLAGLNFDICLNAPRKEMYLTQRRRERRGLTYKKKERRYAQM